MQDDIKRLYDQANASYAKATDIIADAKGNPITPEKDQELQAHLDDVTKFTEQARAMEKTFERMQEQKRTLESAARVPESARPTVFTPDALDAGQKQAALVAASRKYWMTGDPAEIKALSIGSQPGGGYLVADSLVDQVIMGQNQQVAMRSISNVLPPVPAGSVVIPTAVPLADANSNSETGTVVFDTVEPFGSRRLTPHEYDKGILVSTALMRNPRFDIETWIRTQGTLACSRKEDQDFIRGDGAGKALGLINTPNLPTVTTETANQLYGNDVINWVYTLHAAYANNPRTRIICNRHFIRKIRSLSKPDSAGSFSNYIWQPGMSEGKPDTILGVPYVNSDKFDDGLDTNDAWEDNAIVAVIGDFQYYWIVDALELYIQRLEEMYARNKQIGFLFTKSADGMVVLPEAFVALKIKA